MAYSESLAKRIRQALASTSGVAEKKMFGGLCFLLHGNMFVGIVKDDLMVRVGPESYDESLCRPHARPMDFTGRPMKGYVFVGPAGCRTTTAVAGWIERGVEFVSQLPRKNRSR